MKVTLGILLSVTVASQAAIIPFDLSPSGTDRGIGLSPTNETPAVTNSTGSGNEISGGIQFDTATRMLSFALGYGSSAGFSNLTGIATTMHIHGPAGTNQAAAVLFDLAPYNFVATNATNGGVIVGSILYPSNLVASLLAGSNYVNIHTLTNPAGEIRGQLIPALVSNLPPIVSCPAPLTNTCGLAGTVSATISDPNGDALTVVWTLNGSPVQTNHFSASTPGAIGIASYTATFPGGTNSVGITVTDTSTNSTSCSTTVSVSDTTPPTIGTVTANPNTLWPPNGKLVPVTISAAVTDACGTATWTVVSISGATSDSEITGDHTVSLRASKGSDYTITVQAVDAAGNLSATKSVTVSVPKNQSGK